MWLCLVQKLFRGMLLGEPSNPPRAANSFVAKVCPPSPLGSTLLRSALVGILAAVHALASKEIIERGFPCAQIRIEKHPLDRGDEGEEARRAYDIKRGYEPVIDIHTAHVTCKLTRIDYTFVRGKKKAHEKKDVSPWHAQLFALAPVAWARLFFYGLGMACHAVVAGSLPANVACDARNNHVCTSDQSSEQTQ
jgi:hypothetical protein